MNWCELKKKEVAPIKGEMLVYFQKKVLYKKYHDRSELDSLDAMTEEFGKILEIHLFDAVKEYRAILSNSKRYPQGFVEHVADFIPDDFSIYEERILLEDGGKLTVLNHISYSDSGMAKIDDFRLVGKE